MGNNGFFSIDSPLYKAMAKLLDMLKINFLWLLCSLLVVTSGAATTAAFSVIFNLEDGKETYIASSFMQKFKENLKQGSMIGMIQLVIIGIICLDFWLYVTAGEKKISYIAAGVVAIFMAYLHFVYAYALLARYDNTILNTLRNSFSVSVKFFPKTMSLLLLVLMEGVIFLWNYTTMFVGFLIGPVSIIWTISRYAKPMFQQIDAESAENKEQS